MGALYLLSYILDPYIFAFHFRPLKNESVKTIEYIITFFLTFDILLNFFTAVKKEDEPLPVDDFNQKVDTKKRARMNLLQSEISRRDKGLEDPKWERNIAVICCKYLGSEAIPDMLANVPILVYCFFDGFKS